MSIEHGKKVDFWDVSKITGCCMVNVMFLGFILII